MGARQKGDELKGEEEQRCLSFAFQYRFPSCHCDNDATIVVPPYTMYYLPVRSCSCQRGWRPCTLAAVSTYPLHKPYFRLAQFSSIFKNITTIIASLRLSNTLVLSRNTASLAKNRFIIQNYMHRSGQELRNYKKHTKATGQK